MSGFRNTYEDEVRAASYATLAFPGTYSLAFRDLPEILGRHLPPGGRPVGRIGTAHAPAENAPTAPVALDFGCGAGRSTRFLRDLGYAVTGVDISEAMLARARELDPEGDYRLVDDGDLGPIPSASCHLALAAFTFDNIPTAGQKRRALRELGRLLNPGGRVVVIASSVALYTHDWASFRNTGFPENFTACNGDYVWVRMLDIPDARPIQDIRWDDDAYRDTFMAAGLEAEAVYRPLGRDDEPYDWISETEVAPWVIWVLRPADTREAG